MRKAAVIVLVAAAIGIAACSKAPEGSWRSDFAVDKAGLVAEGRNPYFVLEPGRTLHFTAPRATLAVSVLAETEIVDGVTTRVVEERETEGGELVEVSRNFFALDPETKDLYYFGEDVDIYKGGKVVDHEGAWRSGKDGAKFGLMIPGAPKVGDRYYQEYAPRVAMDRAEVAGLGEVVKTPAGEFKDCLKIRETSALEKGTSEKIYAPGVGLIKDDEFVLVETSLSEKEAAAGDPPPAPAGIGPQQARAAASERAKGERRTSQ